MEKLQNLLWLYMILGFTILPAIQKFVATMRRKMLIAKLEKERGTKVVSLIHRQQAGILGMLMMRYINLDDSERLMSEIRGAGNRPIDLIVHTPGGLVLASEQIARVLKAHKPGVTVIVPQYAMSGGTLLAIAADQILMDEHAMLGPIDPQINGMPASAYTKVLAQKEIAMVSDQTIMMADISAKATAQLEAMAYNLLADKLGDTRAREVAIMLTEGRWTHDYPLHVEELQEMGLPVSTRIPPEFWEILGLSNAAQVQIMKKAEPQKKTAEKS